MAPNWADEASAIVALLRPGCAPEIVDQRPMSTDEAWVCVRAGGLECVLGLRAQAGCAVDLLYAYPDLGVLPTHADVVVA